MISFLSFLPIICMALIQSRPDKPSWIKYIHNRVENKKNFLCLISGSTGSGKSWTALSICHMIDKNFQPYQIVTSISQLMALINSGKLKAGSGILWDESGIGLSSKNWQSIVNKMIVFLLQTFRHQRLILIMTCPDISFLDASSRKLIHAEFTTMSIDYKKNKVKIKPFLIQYNSRNRKTYYKYLRVKGKLGIAPIKAWNVCKPPQWLIDEYEEIKTQFTTDLNKDIEEQVRASIEKKKPVTERKPLTDKQRDIMILKATGLDTETISKKRGVTLNTINFHMQQARKKGYSVEEFKEKEDKDTNDKYN